MVFLHDPRIPTSSEDIPVDKVDEGDPASTNNMDSKGKGKEIMEYLPSSKDEKNIILNHDFSEKDQHWIITSSNEFGSGGRVVPLMSKYLEDILPYSGINYLIITRRNTIYHGFEQYITERFLKNVTYKISVWVRLFGGSLGDEEETEVSVVLRIAYSNEESEIEWPVLARAYVLKADGWKNLVGSYKYEGSEKSPTDVRIFCNGPPAGVDLLINSVVMSHSVSKST